MFMTLSRLTTSSFLHPIFIKLHKKPIPLHWLQKALVSGPSQLNCLPPCIFKKMCKFPRDENRKNRLPITVRKFQ